MAKPDRTPRPDDDRHATARRPDPVLGAGTADPALDRLRADILRRVAPALSSAGVARDGTGCRIDPGTTVLTVHVDVPVPVTDAVRRAVAVRVLDAVRGAGRTYGTVHVEVDEPGHATGGSAAGLHRW